MVGRGKFCGIDLLVGMLGKGRRDSLHKMNKCQGKSVEERIWSVSVFVIILLLSFIAMPGQVSALTADDLKAETALLVVLDTGQVLLEKHPDKKMEPASITKIMTMLLALEAVERGETALTDEIVVSPDAEAIGGSQVWLRAGEVFTLEQLLKAVAIQSANDAAHAVAEHIAGSVPAFVRLMNRRAKELGMENTYFANVHGLPVEPGEEPSLTTVRDIKKMTQALIQFPVVLEWTSTWSEIFRPKSPTTVLYNTNRLLREYPDLDGLKTGHTNSAGFCLVATALRDEVRLVSIVMGNSSDLERRADSRRLLDYGFKGFTNRRLVEARTVVGEVTVNNGSPEKVKVVAVQSLDAMVEKGGSDDWEFKLQLRSDLEAPLDSGAVVGALVAYDEDGRLLGQVSVASGEDVKVANIFVRIWRWLRELAKTVVKTEPAV